MDSTKKTARLSSALIALSIATAYWPVLIWFVQRTMDKSDEPWGLIALASAIGLTLINKRASISAEEKLAETSVRTTAVANSPMATVLPGESGNLGIGIICLIAYVCTYSLAPNLVQAILFVLTLWFLVFSNFSSMSKTGTLGLLLISLPVIPSLNFFAGYPVRVFVANGACLMLNITGIRASVEGAMLAVKGQLVAVDAPCSGISMLWAEAYVAMLMACVFRLDWKRTAALSALSVVLILVGNVLRTTTLVLFDQATKSSQLHQLAELEPTVHMAVGLFIFCLITILTICAASGLAGGTTKTLSDIPSIPDSKILGNKSFAIAVVSLCVVCATLPLLEQKHELQSASKRQMMDGKIAWPTIINGNRLQALKPTVEETAFANDFPGSMKHFTDGKCSYFIRSVTSPTRQLHPSSDCFKGLGYRIEPKPMFVAQDGTKWGAFEAANGDIRYLVYERIYDERGVSTTDVSQWYWLACFNKTQGPWFDVTIAQRLTRKQQSASKTGFSAG